MLCQSSFGGEELTMTFQAPTLSGPGCCMEMWRTCEWLSAVPWQHLESKPHDADLPANTLGDTVPASGEPRGSQRSHFTVSGNKAYFPRVSGWGFVN